jgi:hypothetical protein
LLRESFGAVLLIAMSVLMLTDGSGATLAGAGGGSASERRGDERYPVDGDAEVTVLSGGSGAVLLRGRIKNVSQSGCYVETSALRKLAAGTRVDLLFVVRGWLVSAKADSRFSRSKVGMGFRFVEMDTENRSKLDRFVNMVRVRGEDLVLRKGPVAEVPEVVEEKAAGSGSWLDGVRRRR